MCNMVLNLSTNVMQTKNDGSSFRERQSSLDIPVAPLVLGVVTFTVLRPLNFFYFEKSAGIACYFKLFSK
jgi:hypothetical protein